MVRLSLVNLYLHGFADPHIVEYDTLTQDDKWNELADVILANPPFMSPKGGIKPHKRFSVQATRSEVLFVDYMAEHLTATGRAAIVVPEGIIFQSGTAYKALRKMLVETSLVAVVSLPAGVFNPYSGVKTSILFLDKRVHKQTDSVLFVKVSNDGFNLGAQRRAVANSDLPEAARLLRSWITAPQAFEGDGVMAQAVARCRIGEGRDFSLSGDRYLAERLSSSNFPLIPIGSLMKVSVPMLDPRQSPSEVFELWSIPAYDAGAPEHVLGAEIGSAKKLVNPGELLLSRIIPHIRRAWKVCESDRGLRQLGSTEWIVFASDSVLPDYLRRVVLSDQFHGSFMRTITGVGGSLSRANPAAVGEIQIPLPPLEVQQQIVAEIEGYQKVIDGARKVLDGYKPNVVAGADWPVLSLADICTLSSGGTPSKANPDFWNGTIPWISAKEMKVDCLIDAQLRVSVAALKESSTRLAQPGSLLILVRGMGLANGVPICEVGVPCAFNQDVKAIEPAAHVDASFLRLTLQQQSAQFSKVMETAAHGTLKINTADLLKMQVPLPDLPTQRAIVAEIEAEQVLVNANRELIRRMEAKIKAAIDRVWGNEAPLAAADPAPAAVDTETHQPETAEVMP
ncbi:putative type I restriction enzymeP M protein [Hydrogenophaga sp. T4]|nr:putative type I restriction enzymeP M protein [Hydrogenophaga sp. T4]